MLKSPLSEALLASTLLTAPACTPGPEDCFNTIANTVGEVHDIGMPSKDDLNFELRDDILNCAMVSGADGQNPEELCEIGTFVFTENEEGEQRGVSGLKLNDMGAIFIPNPYGFEDLADVLDLTTAESTQMGWFDTNGILVDGPVLQTDWLTENMGEWGLVRLLPVNRDCSCTVSPVGREGIYHQGFDFAPSESFNWTLVE